VDGNRHFQYASPIAEFPLRVNRNVKLIFNLYSKLMMLGVSLRKFCYFETDNRMIRLITMGVVGISRCEEIWFEMFSSDKTTFPIFFVST